MAESVIGPYQLQGQLGAGGMGEVYRATDTRVGRQVAIKLLPESLAQDGDRRRRFEQEARLAASLNDPHIMAVYDVGLDQHPPYIVSEFVPGESLRAIVAKGAIPPRRAVDIAAQVASGLAAAHAAGIVHRDLKPENIIVTPEGTAKILDFGVARMETRAAGESGATQTLAVTSAGSVVGTAAYMSPEQARAEEVDYRSDQFSLGLVLYEMLSGRQAFERPSAVQTMSAIVEDDPPPIERPLVPQLRWILDRCLAKERTARYESTRDLARDLAQLRDRYSEFTGAQSGVERRVRSRARRLWWLIPVCCTGAFMAAWVAARATAPPGGVELSRYRFTPFATELPAQMVPAWSPDGKSIAYCGTPESGRTQLYVQGIDAPGGVSIAGGDDVTVQPFYPPFWASDSHSVYFRCLKDGMAGTCRAPAGGGTSTMVQRYALTADISPDGRTLAMLSSVPEDGGRLRLMVASPPEAPARPYEPQPFAPGVHFNNPSLAFAPDGKKLLVAVALEGRGELDYVIPWPPGKARRLFPRGYPFSGTPKVAWMPDSRHAIFSTSTATNDTTLYMLDTKNSLYWPILEQDRPASAPSPAPDGSRTAYQSGLSHADVIAVPLGDGPAVTLLGSSRTEQMADASPAGSQLVYVTDRRGRQEVWITSLAEGWSRPLFSPDTIQVNGQPAESFFGPVFSHDGRRVAVAAKSGSQAHTYTAFVAGGAAVRAYNSGDNFDMCPSWSPDGNWLAIARLAGTSIRLAKVRPASGDAPIDIAEISSTPTPSWSPAGDWIAAYDDHGMLHLFSPDGKPPRDFPGVGDGGPFAWSRDGKTLYLLSLHDPALSALEIASGRVRKIRDLPGLRPYSMGNPGLHASLTADGESIVYTVNRPRQEIWILDGIQPPRPWWRRLFAF